MTLEEIRNLMKTGDVVKAKTELEAYLKTSPKDNKAKLLYGTCCRLTGDQRTFIRIDDEVGKDETFKQTSIYRKYHALRLAACAAALVFATLPPTSAYAGNGMPDNGAQPLYGGGEYYPLYGGGTLYGGGGYMRCQKQTIRIYFNAGGGRGSMATVSKTVDECSVLTYYLPSCQFTRTGYSFAGWDVNNVCSLYERPLSPGESLDFIYGCGDFHLTATWRAASYVITLSKTGGSGGDSRVTVAYNAWPHAVSVPKRTGYTFTGYYTSSSGGTQYYNASGTATRSYQSTSGMTLYAQWAPQSFKLTFGKNGGSGGDNYVTASYGQYPHSVTPPTKTGYVFDGYWNTLQSGGVRYYDANGYATRSYNIQNGTTLWAKWVPRTYTVTFGKNAGTGGTSSVSATYGAALPMISIPQRTGYVFAGYWDTIKSGGVKYYNADGYSVRSYNRAASTTLYAKWTGVSYRVTFGKNGGTGGDDYVTVTYGATPHALSIPRRPGYVFAGYWNTTGANGKQYFDANGFATGEWREPKLATLWAKWVRVNAVADTNALTKSTTSSGEFPTGTYQGIFGNEAGHFTLKLNAPGTNGRRDASLYLETEDDATSFDCEIHERPNSLLLLREDGLAFVLSTINGELTLLEM